QWQDSARVAGNIDSVKESITIFLFQKYESSLQADLPRRKSWYEKPHESRYKSTRSTQVLKSSPRRSITRKPGREASSTANSSLPRRNWSLVEGQPYTGTAPDSVSRWPAKA